MSEPEPDDVSRETLQDALDLADEQGFLPPVKTVPELAAEMRKATHEEQLLASGQRLGHTAHLLACAVEQSLRQLTGFEQGRLKSTVYLFKGRGQEIKNLCEVAKTSKTLMVAALEMRAQAEHARVKRLAEEEAAKPAKVEEKPVSEGAAQILRVAGTG